MKFDELKKFIFSERFAPWLYLIVCVLAFGLFIPFLGFYWDDWPTIFYTHSERTAQLINHFSYDRPFSVWGYWLIGRLGTAPIAWHLAALLIRWGIVLAFAWALKPAWPEQTRNITLIALIFAVYPGYYLQPSSVIFASHLLTFLFALISFGAMARALTERKRSLMFSVLGVAATAVHLFTLEYFVGLELVRPLYLWLVLENNGIAKRARLKQVDRIWAPYAAVAVTWVMWRLFLLKLPSEPYPVVMLEALKANPIAGLMQLAQIGIQDVVYVLMTAWSQIVQPAFFQLSTNIDRIAWVVVALTFLLMLFILRHRKSKGRQASDGNEEQFAGQALAFGFLSLVAALLPVWMIGERIAQGDYNLRYILVGMFGAALVVGGVIFFFVRQPSHQVLIVSVLVALTIGMHMRAANEYRLDWQEQRAFYWQLNWRAPDFENGTALISFDRATTYLGDPITGNALNVLYPLESQPPNVDVWNFELTRSQTVKAIEDGQVLENHYRGLVFRAQSPESLVFYFKPEGGCLWILGPENVENEYLSFENRDLVVHSDLNTVLNSGEHNPDPTIFGSEPEHDWCYYYEKGDLARQLGEWEEVIALMDEAKAKDLAPNFGVEWLPLLEAYSANGDWELAVEISGDIHDMHSLNDAMLCASWHKILPMNSSENATTAFEQVRGMAACEQN